MELTREEILKHQRELEVKQQNEFAKKILEDIRWWYEKANRKSYKPTAEENCAFIEILNIVNCMNNTGLMTHIPD